MDSKTNWIPVNHQFPEFGTSVLGLNITTGEMNVVWVGIQRTLDEFPASHRRTRSVATFQIKTSHFLGFGEVDSYTDMGVTHWMPLPDIPR